MGGMTPRERVLATLEHQEPDRVPMDFGNLETAPMIGAPYGYEALCRFLGIVDYQQPTIFSLGNVVSNSDERVLDRLGVDFRSVWPSQPQPEILANGLLRDAWGIVLKPSGAQIGVPNECCPLRNAKTLKEIDEYPYWPDTHSPLITEGIREKAKNYRDRGYAVFASAGYGMMHGHMYAFLRGFDRWLLDMKWDKEFARALYEKIGRVAIDYSVEFLSAIADYVDVIELSDDLGMQTQSLMSLEDYREFIKPHHKKWIAEIERVAPRAKIFFHSCGAIRQFIPDLIQMGVDILNPLQPLAAGMEPEALKRDFGDKLCFHGGIDLQRLLPFGSPEEIRAEVRAVLRTLAPGGGYILAPANAVPQEVPPQNLLAMYEAGKQHGAYPIEL